MNRALRSFVFLRSAFEAIASGVGRIFIFPLLSPVNPMAHLVTFREAAVASPTANMVRSLLYTALFWVLFFGAIPYVIVTTTASFGLVAGRFDGLPWWVPAAVFACGLVPVLTSVSALATVGRGTPWYGACPRKLTAIGLYRYVRNPLILGLVIQGIAVGLAWGSPWVLGYCLLGGPLWHALLKPAEEADLEVRFRGDYRLYKHAVPCWLPRITPYRPRA